MHFDADTIIQLEKSLFQRQVRQSTEKLDRLLADNFKEFTSTGEVYFKSDALLRLPDEVSAVITAGEFKVTQLSDTSALITYRSILKRDAQATRYFLRSSVWQAVHNVWQMVFNQGTLCPAFEIECD